MEQRSGVEGTRRGRESAKEIFERGARSEQRNDRLHSEGRVQEEQAESESGKRAAKFEDKMEGREECTECWRKEKEGKILSEKRVCQ
jgi:hypothetical protein